MHSKKVDLKFLRNFFFLTWISTIIIFVAYTAYILKYPITPLGINGVRSTADNILPIIGLADVLIGVLSFLLMGLVLIIGLFKGKNAINNSEMPTTRLKKAKYGLVALLLLIILGSTGYIGYTFVATKESKPTQVDTLGVMVTPSPFAISDPTALPTVNPTATKTKASIKTPVNDPDPIVNCHFQHLGTQNIKQSQCAKSFECQIGSQWYIYDDYSKCSDDQKKNASQTYIPYIPSTIKSNSSDSYMNCSIYNAQTGQSELYYMKVSECNSKMSAQNQANNDYYAAKKEYDAKNDELQKQHDEACQQAYSGWAKQKEDFYANEMNNFDNTGDAQLELIRRMNILQQQLYDAGCTQKLYLR